MLAAWLCYLLYSVTSVCIEEMRHSGKSCCHGSSTAVAAAAAAGIPKNAPEEASHRQVSLTQVSKGAALELGPGGTTSLKTRVEEDPHLAARIEVGDLERATHQGADPRPAGSKRCPHDLPSVPCRYTNLNKVGLEHSHSYLYRQADHQQSCRWLQRCQEVDRTGFYPHSALPHWEEQDPGPDLITPDQSLDQRQSRGVSWNKGSASLLFTLTNYPRVPLFQCPKCAPPRKGPYLTAHN